MTTTVRNPTAATNLASILQRMAVAARDRGRKPTEISLIAVSKTYNADAIRPVLDAGHRVFGENRVQEAQAKWPDLRTAYAGVDLHLIGQLQSNKAREAVALFDCIHALDRPSLATALAGEIKRQGRRPKLFVQVNTGDEAQKGGVAPRALVEFLTFCRITLGLTIAGLMCIPPTEDMPAPHFALLAKLAADVNVPELSMGMSADFECAISLGATHVRVGSAIFGGRG